jgi:hypothetical protein
MPPGEPGRAGTREIAMSDDTQFEQGSGPAPPNAPLPPDATDTSPGKHAILMVPDFKLASGGAQPMTSYLRLGDAHSQAGPAVSTGPGAHPLRTDLGEDLAAMVQGFTDDLRLRDGGTGDDACPPESFPTPPGAPTGTLPGPLTIEQRRAESRKLHSKGGWRDHSDGNRVTTTRGDKIEVIRGNYKMLVLGRSDGFGDAAGMELSGGNLDTSSEDLAFGSGTDGVAGSGPDPTRNVAALQTTFEWFLSDGHWGWRQTVKSGHPDKPNGNNGQIITKTWVDLQETDLGSPELPVNQVLSTTHATTMVNTTFVRDSTDTLNVGTSTQTINGGTVNQFTNASQSLRNGIVADGINNTTSSPKISNFTDVAVQSTIQAAGANFIGNAYGLQVEIDVASLMSVTLQLIPLIVNLQIASTIMTTLIGTCIDSHLGLHLDTHSGVHVDNHSGSHIDLHSGIHAQFDNTSGMVTIHSAGATSIAASYGVTISGTTFNLNEQAVIDMAAAHNRL